MDRATSLQGSSRLLLLLLFFLSLISLSLAGSPTSFCKCTCFSNSTIIPLDPAKSTSSSSPLDNVLLKYRRLSAGTESEHMDDGVSEYEKRAAAKYRPLTCNDCNRKFCLDYELPTCKGAKEEDVFTTCFQRDSHKDEAVVFIFIIATASLVAWAALRPWVEKWLEAARERRSYIPVAQPETR
ncbi:uncharacterized protein PFLUO_LOCUS2898 [Penicillium psychrofluorescens]|uniref:uncharacterized protein n=1 Tax=Penicillium psychrofluorescens TaxID=3158075 RepID=UPI003CCD89B1